MRILALDTATLTATVALWRDGHVDAEDTREVTTHSEGLLALVHSTLEQAETCLADVDAVACGQGPGSFTGLRIGMATAKGLCYGASKPLVCVSSLAALAYGAKTEAVDRNNIVAILDARRGEIYVGAYGAGKCLQADFICKPDELASLLQIANPLCVGDGALAYRDIISETIPDARFADPALCYIRGGSLAALAANDVANANFADLHESAPVYLRAPDIRKPGGK